MLPRLSCDWRRAFVGFRTTAFPNVAYWPHSIRVSDLQLPASLRPRRRTNYLLLSVQGRSTRLDEDEQAALDAAAAAAGAPPVATVGAGSAASASGDKKADDKKGGDKADDKKKDKKK